MPVSPELESFMVKLERLTSAQGNTSVCRVLERIVDGLLGKGRA
jgi:hypothetical protein